MIEAKQDDKAVKLVTLLKDHVAKQGEKVIVFVERHATAVFLAEFIVSQKLAKLYVGCTIARQGKEKYTLKDDNVRNDLLDNFSPISRKATATEPLNVLICTDANGIGVNLQDANVVVNYDTADSADILFQRAGRVIRFTEDPHRRIYFYTFKPTIALAETESSACRRIERVFDNMSKHHGHSKRTFGLSILPEAEQETIDLNDPQQESDFVSQFNLAKGSPITDPLFMHTAILHKHRALAASIRNGIYSSMLCRGKENRIALLVQEGVEKHVILYNLTADTFEHSTNYVPIIDLIACKPATQNAPISFEKIEQAAVYVLDKWRHQFGITNKISLNCCLYIKPKTHRTFITELFTGYIKLRDKIQQKKEAKQQTL